MFNFNSQALDDLAARIGQALQNSPAKDLQQNVKSLLSSSLSRLDLVSREEFDVQARVLQRTREKLERLEARVRDLEAKIAGTNSSPAS